MEQYAIQEGEVTPAALFEDSYKRMGLRSLMSNALMAIYLYEADTKSSNLEQYVEDGLAISQNCIAILESLQQSSSPHEYHDYYAKVLLDILTGRLMRDLDLARTEQYREGFMAAQSVFTAIRQEEKLDQEVVEQARRLIEEIDEEIEVTYQSEESLYRGSLIPRYV